MSVFSDFQTAWAQRFPGCELPQAWEEDVRANLAKHQDRVAFLREELEKEEFYVEYLERLLADVERVKRSIGNYGDEEEFSSQNGGPSVDITANSDNESLARKRDASPSNYVSESIEVEREQLTVQEENSNHVDSEKLPIKPKIISSNSSRASTASSNSGLQENANTEYDNHANPYVTVIEVGGSNDALSDAGRSDRLVSSESESSVSQIGSSCGQTKAVSDEKKSSSMSPHRKKKPPTPPPKKSRRPVSTFSSKDSSISDNHSEDAHLVASEPVTKQTADTGATVLVSENVEKHSPSSFRPPLPPKHQVSQELLEYLHSPLQENIGCELVNEPGSNKQENEIQSLRHDCHHTGQAIYDIVAPDDEPIQCDSLERSSHSVHNSISATAGDDTEGEEGDYVVFSERAFLPQSSGSQESMQGLQSVTMDEDSSSVPKDRDSPDYATYMNIDYFLRHKEKFGAASHGESFTVDSDDDDALLVRSFSSDQELEVDSGINNNDMKTVESSTSASADDVFDVDSGVYSSSVESTSFLCTSGPSTPPSNKKANKVHDLMENEENELSKEEVERLAMYKCIVSSICEGETTYVECLTILLQYMKALKSTIGTSQPLLSLEDFTTIFFKIPELHSIHLSFLQGLKKYVEHWDGRQTAGEHFKMLASKLGIYASYLQNYSKAVDTVRKCSTGNTKFSEITKGIKLKYLKGQATTLEDLLHIPVARVQKNAMVLHDLLRYAPLSHPDQKTLKTALKMTQCFLNDLNVTATESLFPTPDRAQRHLVKNSFIVELAESHRKLRHLFLFNDVVVCAKYKPSTRQKFTFEIKWYVPLAEVTLPDVEGEPEGVRENSPLDVLALKSRASNVRDQILKEERIHQNKDKQKVAGRNLDKQKKKLAELEAQLVLASPNLVFRVGQKNAKTYTFFLSSEFERSQWIEAISVLQSSAPSTTLPLSTYELQAWITSCRKHLGTNLGSFLLRSGKDEDLLVGDLHLIVHCLHGLSRPLDIYLCFEVDSYGHFFNKAKTKVCRNSAEAHFNQDFIIELEGSQTLRILCYEDHASQGAILRGKAALELSRSWLTDKMQEKSISLQEFMLTISLKFIPTEMTLRRIPSSKTVGLFGVKIQQVCKKEKMSVPFIITSCVREVEKRGMSEIGIYRVSGSASDVQRLKKTFESNIYEAEQLLKEVDIHTVTGLLKLYLRELPEALFTDNLYPKVFMAFTFHDQDEKRKQLLLLFGTLPQVNQEIILYLIDHMVRVNHHEASNKMSLHNLATVFGPTVLRPGNNSSSSSPADLLTAGTVDVMAQAGILYFFLKRRASGLALKSESE